MSSFSNLETPYVAEADTHEANPVNNALPANTPNDTNPPPAKTYANPKWAYKKGLTPYERVSHVYDVLRYQHGWSIPDFLDALVAAEPPPGKSGIQRVQAFQKALQQESIIKLLPVIERDPATQRREYINTIRSEITDLREQYAIFGKYKPSTPIDEIGLSEMSMAIQRTAPELHQLLLDLMQSYTTDRNIRIGDGLVACICALIVYGGAPQSSNQFSSLFGLYLLSMGAKRRVIDVCHGLGLTPSYTTLQRRMKDLTDLGKVNSS